tara:strand:+ start:121 stop:678 length:558 start_codon:yes stop_codon:yes gene_type:complete
MKKTNLKLASILISFLVLLTACPVKTTQKITTKKSEDNLKKEYCTEVSDNKFFRANTSVKHPDLGESAYEATQQAKALLAENISQKVKSVTDRYKKTRTINGVVEFDKSVEGIVRFSSEVNLSDVRVVCSKVIRLKEENLYQRFVSVEMSKDAIIKEIENKISKDDAMYQDYRRSEMRKLLESEL